MASAQEEELSVLQEELTCPVCLDVYRDPHLLPCGHNFCLTCLRRLKRQAERGRFRCPECRDSHRISTSFQKNFKLANIAEDFRRRGRAFTATASASTEPHLLPLVAQPHKTLLSVPCDYCPPAGAEATGNRPDGEEAPGASGEQGTTVSTLAIKTCLKCEVSMCQDHVRPHLELPAFREHPLTEPLNDLRKRKCPDHDEMYRYYCMDEKVCVCNACTIEGGHSGHTIKTLKNTMKDFKGVLDKQLYRLERMYSTAEKKLHEQKEKERQNRKFLEDSEQYVTRLGEEMKVKVDVFVSTLLDWTRIHCASNGPAIQKNMSRLCLDQARLHEVRVGIEGLMVENDPFRFIDAYKTAGKHCRRQLKKSMFYPEYVDMDKDVLGATMKEEMMKFLNVELHSPIVHTINSLCYEEEEHEENEEEEEEEEEDDDDDDDDSSEEEEEMRSEGEEEEGEPDQSESADDIYTPEGEEEDDEDEDDGEDEEDEGV
ncbi:E3 ubiquitin/ISG15 ligase TRIM25 [Lampris incognitus]|uniref:E3 ubiquitin/ISG15 ligase TRIM25 n=1 Tax=Lampris incognitus TaxID=2546036 RepID=UPI0024B5D5FB|nr:E3 ubiquitin/ISG15 ligase TRIM25 [Lampris incognitus]XP_056156850.1 E3 ubiquitin/ISG15 ligase TRIM25 [Lampris incognitus]